jgi:TetR/AcrR family transcriptional regulator, cholesterol catabolism regulator
MTGLRAVGGGTRAPTGAAVSVGSRYELVADSWMVRCCQMIDGTKTPAKAASRKGRAKRSAAAEPVGLTREDILDEAATQFRKNGYERTRLQDIATRFGVTHAALYYYFRRKSDILVALNVAAMETLLNGVRELVDVDDPAVRFERMFEAHIVFVAGNLPMMACFFEHDSTVSQEDFRTIRHLRRQYNDTLISTFEQAQNSGSFTSGIKAGTAVNTLLGAVNWMYRWHNPDVPPDLTTLTQELQAMLASGYRCNTGHH